MPSAGNRPYHSQVTGVTNAIFSKSPWESCRMRAMQVHLSVANVHLAYELQLVITPDKSTRIRFVEDLPLSRFLWTQIREAW